MLERARRLWRYLMQPRSDPVIAAVLAVLCLTELLVSSDGSGLALGVVEVLLLCAPLFLLRTHPVAVTCETHEGVRFACEQDEFAPPMYTPSAWNGDVPCHAARAFVLGAEHESKP